MAKKKKGKKETPEEKALREREEGEAAAIAHVKKTELATAFLKEKLEQEERNTRISLRKLNEQWRAILRAAKATDLKKDISILEQTFERMLDRKDAVIKALIKDLGEAETQESMALQTHIQNVDHLVAFQESMMGEHHDLFNDELQELKGEFMSERGKIILRHDLEMSNIKDMLFAMQMKHEDEESELNDEFNSKRDEIKTKSLEAIESLRGELEKKISDLWDLFQQALQNYKQTTKAKQESFEYNKVKDKDDADEIKRQSRRLAKINESIEACKASMESNRKECEIRNRQLKHEKEEVLLQFQDLKLRMNKSRSKERVMLTQLTVESRDATDKLKTKLERAKGLLRQAEMCRKLETEAEKVLPFYSDSVNVMDVAAAAGEEMPVPDELPEKIACATTLTTGQIVDGRTALDSFWKRYNKSLLDKLAAQKDRDTLQEENQRLRSILKQYLDGISVSESVLAQENTLMVVNGRTNAPLRRAMPVGDPRVQMAGKQAGIEVQAGQAHSDAARA